MTGRGIDQVLPNHVHPRIYELYVRDARYYSSIAEKKSGAIPAPVSYPYIWGDALEVWEQLAPDLKLINLETSITTHQVPWPGKPIQYRMHPDNVEVLTAAGIDCCSLANNHVLDWQRPGLSETLRVLRQARIAYAGAGEDKAEAQKPALLRSRNGRVLVFAYGSPTGGIPKSWAATRKHPGVNLLPDYSRHTASRIGEQVRQAKQAGDVVVFSVHWGSNWAYTIAPKRRDFAHLLIDVAGVDLVFGHSSHHPLGIEVYKGKLILYGVGDFINDYEGIRGHDEFRGHLSLMFFPQLHRFAGQLMSLRMVPMQIRKFRLQHASPSDAIWLAQTLDRESQKLGAGVSLQQDGTLSLRL